MAYSSDPIVPPSTLDSAAALAGSASATFGSVGHLFFIFCQAVGLILAGRAFYMIYEKGDERAHVSFWTILKTFLVSATLFYLHPLLSVAHNTFPNLFPNI